MVVENNDSTGVEPPTEGMIDIQDKIVTRRTAIAQGTIFLTPESIIHIKNKTNPKGDVLENAKLAAIHAVKKTPELVFMCHPIKIRGVKVGFAIEDNAVTVTVRVIAEDKTGVEVEAMAGVMNALLAIFDLSKRFEKDIDGQYISARISDIKITYKKKEELQ